MARFVSGNRTFLIRLTVVMLAATCVEAADFDFATIIRAGRPNSNAGNYELGIGPGDDNSLNRGDVDPPNYYQDGVARQFAIGYTSSTNTAFLRYYYSATNYYEVTYAPGGQGLGANSMWTIPDSALFAAANNRPTATSISVSNLAFGPGVQVLQPFSQTTLTAAQGGSGGFVRTNMVGNTVFRAGASGDWLLTGTVAFNGLAFNGNTGAFGSQLRTEAEFYGSSEVPETGTWALMLAGLAGLFAARRNRARRVPVPVRR